MAKIKDSSIGNLSGSRFSRTKTHCQKTAQSQKGQAIIYIVIILPILALLLNYFFQFLVLLQATKSVQKQCRTQALQAQNMIIHGFNDLIKLNPEADRLRQRKQAALRAFRAAVGPEARAAAAAYLAFVEAQQRLFQAQQLTIITEAKAKAKIAIYKIRGQAYTNIPPFSLSPRPKGSITPSYFKSVNFVERQEIIIPWLITNSLGQIQEGECGSYIKANSQRYIAKISFPGR